MVSQSTQQLIDRLKELGETQTIEEGTKILMGLRKINGAYTVDEITNDKMFPITIKSLSQIEERRYDISRNQFYMGRIRLLGLKETGRLRKKNDEKC